jgi:Solute carrier family 12
MTYAQRSRCLGDASRFIHVHKLRAFFSLVDGLNFEQGARALLQATGIGKLRPNVLLMGYKNEWLLAPNEETHQYFNVLQSVNNILAISMRGKVFKSDLSSKFCKKSNCKVIAKYLHFSEAFDTRLAVAILRVKGGLDFSRFTEAEDLSDQSGNSSSSAPSLSKVASDSFINLCEKISTN